MHDFSKLNLFKDKTNVLRLTVEGALKLNICNTITRWVKIVE